MNHPPGRSQHLDDAAPPGVRDVFQGESCRPNEEAKKVYSEALKSQHQELGVAAKS